MAGSELVYWVNGERRAQRISSAALPAELEIRWACIPYPLYIRCSELKPLLDE